MSTLTVAASTPGGPGGPGAPGGPPPDPGGTGPGAGHGPTDPLASAGAFAVGAPGAGAVALTPRNRWVPLRPLSVGEVLDGGVDVVRRHAGPMFAVSTLAVGVELLLSIPLLWVFTTAVARLGASPEGPGGGGDVLLVLVSLTVWSLVTAMASTIGLTMTIATASVAVRAEGFDRRTTLRSAWSHLRPVRGRLLLLALALTGINTVLGAIPLGGLLVIAFGGVARLSICVLIFEQVGVGAALKRGWQVGATGTTGGFFRGFGVRLLAGLMCGLVWLMLAFSLLALLGTLVSLAASPGEPSAGFLLLATAAASLALYGPLTVIWAFRAGVDTLLYVDGRMRGEGLDIEWALAARAARLGRADR